MLGNESSLLVQTKIVQIIWQMKSEEIKMVMVVRKRSTYKKAKFVVKPFDKCHNIFNVLISCIINFSYQRIHKFSLSLNICLYLHKKL